MKTEDCENKEGDEEEEEEEAASGNSVQPRSGKQLKFDSPSSSKSKAAITPKNASKSKVGAKSESKSKRGKTKRIGSKSKVDGAKVESVKPRDEATPKSATVDDAVVPSGGDKEKSGDKASKPAKKWVQAHRGFRGEAKYRFKCPTKLVIAVIPKLQV